MPSSIDNVKLGVCQVFYGGVDLGYTQGGVEVSVTTETHKVEVDQFGKTPINESIMGRQVMVKVPLAETTLENLVAIMPGATISGVGNDRIVKVTNGVGVNLLSVAKELRLHPKGKAVTDKSDDFVIPRAATAGALTFAYKVDQERIFNCDFMGYPDDANGGVLFSLGGDDGVV